MIRSKALFPALATIRRRVSAVEVMSHYTLAGTPTFQFHSFLSLDVGIQILF